MIGSFVIYVWRRFISSELVPKILHKTNVYYFKKLKKKFFRALTRV